MSIFLKFLWKRPVVLSELSTRFCWVCPTHAVYPQDKQTICCQALICHRNNILTTRTKINHPVSQPFQQISTGFDSNRTKMDRVPDMSSLFIRSPVLGSFGGASSSWDCQGRTDRQLAAVGKGPTTQPAAGRSFTNFCTAGERLRTPARLALVKQ